MSDKAKAILTSAAFMVGAIFLWGLMPLKEWGISADVRFIVSLLYGGVVGFITILLYGYLRDERWTR